MQISVLVFICVIATFAIIEAVPWYRREKPQRYEETDYHGSSNGLKSERYVGNLDRDVELITSTTSTKRAGAYNDGVIFPNDESPQGNDEYQRREQEQGVGKDLDQNGYIGGTENVPGYGKHYRRRTNIRRWGQDSSESENSEDDDDVNERPSQGCRGCSYNNIGNGRKNYNKVYMNKRIPQRDRNDMSNERNWDSSEEIGGYQKYGGYKSYGVYQETEQQQYVPYQGDDYQDGDEYQSRRGYGSRGRYDSRGATQGRGRSAGRTQDDDSGDMRSEEFQYVPKSCKRCSINNIGNGYRNRNKVYAYD